VGKESLSPAQIELHKNAAMSVSLTSQTQTRRLLPRALQALLWSVAGAFLLWSFGALHFDFPVRSGTVAWGFLAGVLALVLWQRGSIRKLASVILPCFVVLIWWLSQKPSNDRAWQPDVAQLAWAEIQGDEVTLHNIRNCAYRSETDFTPHWETRKLRLSQITGVDLFINYWGSPYMAHPIVSFQFADAPPLCFSIETRKEVGEKYSAIGGIYRRYELIFLVADERDVVRLRTNYRKDQDAYLYRTTISPERARERFLEYLTTLNQLRETPRWYNAITTNCTTAIRSQHPTSARLPWDWRILVNGKGDEMLYERKAIIQADLPFAELREKALINTAARSADQSPDFSQLIRKGRPGLSPAENAPPN
jgi:hypothetical protein